MSEIFRAGIQSVDKGQMEAARSLGLGYGKSMQRVVLPQAIRTMIPSIINQFIISLKDTSILSVIGFPELTKAGNIIVGNTFNALGVWGIVAIMYMVVIVTLSHLAKAVERKVNVGNER
jgi:ABC-type amino acid transport system permease subunit